MQTDNMPPSSLIEFKASTLKLILLLATGINLGYTILIDTGSLTEQADVVWVNLFFSFETLALFWHLRRRPDSFFNVSAILAFSGFLFFCGMAILEPTNNYRLIWFLPLVIFTFFFINALHGFSMFLLVSSFILFIQNYVPNYLSEGALSSLLLCLVAVAILAHHFSKQIHAYEDAIVAQNEQLQEWVTHDQMTGILNRQGIMEASEQYFNLAKRQYISALCMVVFDIDHFKSINDNYGHLIGDKSLKMLSQIINNILRKSDLIARMGGDEFILLLPETNARQAEKLMTKIQMALSEHSLTVGSEEIYIHCSAGIAQLTPAHNSFKELFKAADVALYKAKERGRNQFCVADDSTSTEA